MGVLHTSVLLYQPLMRWKQEDHLFKPRSSKPAWGKCLKKKKTLKLKKETVILLQGRSLGSLHSSWPQDHVRSSLVQPGSGLLCIQPTSRAPPTGSSPRSFRASSLGSRLLSLLDFLELALTQRKALGLFHIHLSSALIVHPCVFIYLQTP